MLGQKEKSREHAGVIRVKMTAPLLPEPVAFYPPTSRHSPSCRSSWGRNPLL